MDSLARELAEAYMPDIDWDRYEIEKIEKIQDKSIEPFTWRVNFFVVEKNIKPEWYENDKNIISKWFYNTKKVKDFQVRTKIATLNMKRRKWYNPKNKKIISKDIDFGYKRQSPDDFINFFQSFLKDEKWVSNYAHCLPK